MSRKDVPYKDICESLGIHILQNFVVGNRPNLVYSSLLVQIENNEQISWVIHR